MDILDQSGSVWSNFKRPNKFLKKKKLYESPILIT